MIQDSGENIDVTALWTEYARTKDVSIRDALVEHYLFLVHIIAGRVAISLPPHVDRDDLLSSGFFGLLDAVSRYDYSRGNKFETYAGVRIRGSMLDYLRSKDWIPVSLRQKIRKYEKAVASLEGRFGRSATDSEIAASLDMTQDELQALINKSNVATIIPLEDYVRVETPQENEDDPLEQVEKMETRDVLAAAIEELPDKERKVVSLYYYEELTMKEISLVMHLSEARICQLHTKAVFRLRGSLARNKDNSME